LEEFHWNDSSLSSQSSGEAVGTFVVGSIVVGESVGVLVVGDSVGAPIVGTFVGFTVVGESVGDGVSLVVGDSVGAPVVGKFVGFAVVGDGVALGVVGDWVGVDVLSSSSSSESSPSNGTPVTVYVNGGPSVVGLSNAREASNSF